MKYNYLFILSFLITTLEKISEAATGHNSLELCHKLWHQIHNINFTWWNLVSTFLWPKWDFTPFSQTFQQNALCLKLFKKMPLFWNLIFRKSSFNLKLDFWTIELQRTENYKKKKKNLWNLRSWNSSSLKVF